MKDAGIKACVAMVCITVVYTAYMLANAIAGNAIPDGIILGGVAVVVAGLGGYSVAVANMLRKEV
jgi:hypothetical protein